MSDYLGRGRAQRSSSTVVGKGTREELTTGSSSDEGIRSKVVRGKTQQAEIDIKKRTRKRRPALLKNRFSLRR